MENLRFRLLRFSFIRYQPGFDFAFWNNNRQGLDVTRPSFSTMLPLFRGDNLVKSWSHNTYSGPFAAVRFFEFWA